MKCAIKRTILGDGKKQIMKLTLPRSGDTSRTIFVVTDGDIFRHYKTEVAARKKYAEWL